MYELFIKLQRELAPVVRSGDLLKCEETVIKELALIPESPFHIVAQLKITNPSVKVAKYFDKHFQAWNREHTIGAAYTEMNGFDINWDCWFFNIFAYEEYGGHDSYNWLSRPIVEGFDGMVITGLEPLQKVYASDALSGQYEDTRTLAGLLVVIKFQQLIQNAALFMKKLNFPLLATAHDYDFIYEARLNT
jgi:hypothetical protein